MRLAIISDIHGNLAALDAVLRELESERLDQVVCLGDVAATGPQPREVIARLRSLGCAVVMGNADAYLLDPQPAVDADEDARKVEAIDRWCAAQLSAADWEYLRTFQPTIAVPLGGDKQLLCFHGSPRSYNDVISATTSEAELAPMFDGYMATVMVGGHWHFQMLRRYGEGILLNPGSIGLAYDKQADGGAHIPARAEYALLTAANNEVRSIELRRVPYDREATVRAMFERGMPYAAWWAGDWR
ncbi:MAG: metallophosphoesterase family protein [Herpetosiphonaceae bacterium]|nr:metallophosphoesterase family protein [Herpetosiphonaceae bacterium]